MIAWPAGNSVGSGGGGPVVVEQAFLGRPQLFSGGALEGDLAHGDVDRLETPGDRGWVGRIVVAIFMRPDDPVQHVGSAGDVVARARREIGAEVVGLRLLVRALSHLRS